MNVEISSDGKVGIQSSVPSRLTSSDISHSNRERHHLNSHRSSDHKVLPPRDLDEKHVLPATRKRLMENGHSSQRCMYFINFEYCILKCAKSSARVELYIPLRPLT